MIDWGKVLYLFIGIFAGTILWYPYHLRLKQLLKKKRETTSILKELQMNEREHMQYMTPEKDLGSWSSPTHWASTTTTNMNPNNWVPGGTYQSYDSLTKAYADMMAKWGAQASPGTQSQTYRVQNGTFASGTTASTNLNAGYCTRCNGLVGAEPHSCGQGIDAR